MAFNKVLLLLLTTYGVMRKKGPTNVNPETYQS